MALAERPPNEKGLIGLDTFISNNSVARQEASERAIANAVNSFLASEYDPREPFRVDVLHPTHGGQTSFSLSHPCSEPATATLDVNGATQTPAVNFTVSGATLVWTNVDFELDSTDTLVVTYQV